MGLLPNPLQHYQALEERLATLLCPTVLVAPEALTNLMTEVIERESRQHLRILLFDGVSCHRAPNA